MSKLFRSVVVNGAITSVEITADQYDAISGDLYEIETCETDHGQKYFVRGLVPSGDVTTVSWESELQDSEAEAWNALHVELCRRSRKPATTRWLLKAHRTILVGK